MTLNIAFSNTGIMTEYVSNNKIINKEVKEIRVLLLNPYSMNAITRSIQESRPLKPESNPTEDICKHTLAQHKQEILYRDFERTISNIKDLIQNSSTYKVNLQCHIYSSASPNFLLINGKRAISENLILGRRKDEPKGKLYGILPHLVYGNGKIKESLEVHFDYLWDYDSVALEDFHEEVEEKYYEINRLFLLYNLQKEIWEAQWKKKGRSRDSEFDILYQDYKELYPGRIPRQDPRPGMRRRRRRVAGNPQRASQHGVRLCGHQPNRDRVLAGENHRAGAKEPYSLSVYTERLRYAHLSQPLRSGAIFAGLRQFFDHLHDENQSHRNLSQSLRRLAERGCLFAQPLDHELLQHAGRRAW